MINMVIDDGIHYTYYIFHQNYTFIDNINTLNSDDIPSINIKNEPDSKYPGRGNVCLKKKIIKRKKLLVRMNLKANLIKH